MATSRSSSDSPSASSTSGGTPNTTVTTAPAQADRSRVMHRRAAAASSKRVLLSELRYSLNDLDSIRFGEVHGTLTVATATRGLPRPSSQLSS